MNYEEMSDLQINLLVANAVGVDAVENSGVVFGAVRHEGSNVVSVIGVVDYCNNPSDAMPILTENKIGFKWVNGSCTASSVLRGYRESESENPLRAAMIVFLMMEDAKNVD